MAIGCARSSAAAEPGVLEGHLKIVSLKGVQLDDTSPSKGTVADYASYPLLILSKGEIGRASCRERVSKQV